jgi:antitoxin (DNA-binding transcriptional repressor) of toxin-antitoxin stability system
VRVETTVGVFEVNAKNADLLRRMIAGEKVPVQFYAGAD